VARDGLNVALGNAFRARRRRDESASERMPGEVALDSGLAGNALHERCNGAPSAVLLDFADVNYADSTTLAELLRFHQEASAANVKVALLVKSKQFARVIEYAGLGGAFELFDRRSSALSYLAGVQG